MDKETAIFIASCVSQGTHKHVPASSVKSAMLALHSIAASHGPDTRSGPTPEGRLRFKCTGKHEVPPGWPCDTYTTVQNVLLDAIVAVESARNE